MANFRCLVTIVTIFDVYDLNVMMSYSHLVQVYQTPIIFYICCCTIRCMRGAVNFRT